MSREYVGEGVVITGASTGIGKSCALHLAEKGVRVFAGVRSETDGAALQQESSGDVIPVLIDVTGTDTIDAARQRIEGIVGEAGLAGLVNNAGIYFGGPMEFSSIDEMKREFEINLFGAIAVTQAFLPQLRAGRGRIVNMSSISGVMALPFLGPYAASKFALEAISDSWRVELRPWGISVAVIEPGVVDTPMREKMLATLREVREAYPPEARELYGPIFGLAEKHEPHTIPAERVAKAVEHALFARKPKLRYRVGAEAKSLAVFLRMPVRFRDWLIARHLPAYP